MKMRKMIATMLAIIVLALGLSACGCFHQWEDATCIAPKTCKLCQETLGDRLGHQWSNATCTENKTCSRCGAVGEEAPGHSWAEATTEAPKTCRICGVTEGDRIITDPRFTSAAAAPFVGTWEGKISVSSEEMGYAGVTSPLVYTVRLTFGKAGEFTSKVELASGLPMRNEVVRLVAEDLYASYAAFGKDKAAADAAMKDLRGVTVTEYAAYYVQQKNYTYKDTVTSQMTGVYYVEEDNLYIATAWTDTMTKVTCTIEQGCEGGLVWTDPTSGRTCTLSFVMG